MFKKLLLVITFFSIAPLWCMEPGKKRAHVDDAAAQEVVADAAAQEAETDIVKIQTQDGQDFDVPMKLVTLSETLKNLIEDAGNDNPIPLPTVTSATWRLILEQLKRVHEMRIGIKDENKSYEERGLQEWELKKDSREAIIQAYRNLDVLSL